MEEVLSFSTHSCGPSLTVMTDPISILAITCVFFLAGGVKGVIGLGLPTVSLGLMTAIMDLPTAMSLMLVPTFVTNVVQATTGGYTVVLLRRIWLFLLLATVIVGLGGLVLQSADLSLMSALLGLVLVAYAVMGFSGVHFRTPPEREGTVGGLMGFANGFLTGMVGSYAVPGVMYLQSLDMPRDQFVQAMGMLFLGSTIALAVTLSGTNLMSSEAGIASVLATAPAFVGFLAGQKIRKQLSEMLFRRLFYAALLVLGLFICIKALAI